MQTMVGNEASLCLEKYSLFKMSSLVFLILNKLYIIALRVTRDEFLINSSLVVFLLFHLKCF